MDIGGMVDERLIRRRDFGCPTALGSVAKAIIGLSVNNGY